MSNPYAPPKEGASRPDLRPDATRAPRGPSAPPGGPAPHGQRPATPPGPPPDPETVRQVSRQLLHFWFLVLASAVAAELPLPFKVGALVLVVAAIVVGGRALVTTWRARIPGLLLPMIVAGLAFAGVITLMLVMTFAMWPLFQAREDCLRSALTVAAQHECDREVEGAVTDWRLGVERSLGGRPASD